MTIDRRRVLTFLGAGTGSALLSACVDALNFQSHPNPTQPFSPTQSPIPLVTDGIPLAHQVSRYSTYEIYDDLVLPPGYTYEVLATWGDRVGDSRFGSNNDYIGFVPAGKDEGYLVVNFEYISGLPWKASIETIVGRTLPFRAVEAAIAQTGGRGLDVWAMTPDNPLRAQALELCQEALIDMGIAVLSIKRLPNGRWQRSFSDRDRRVTGISGWRDQRYLGCTGPAKTVFQKTQGMGYIDGLSDRIVGTFQNCGGGTTPWGTVLSAEENYQAMVIEPVFADGTAFPPHLAPLFVGDEGVAFAANALGCAGNKYGWMVEIDPANPQDYGTKHTWLGRFRHEAVAIRTEPRRSLAVYSGCDRRGGHLYKFISRDQVKNPTDKANSQLLHAGMLYVAQFYPNGRGRWIPLRPQTPIDPTPLAFLSGHSLPLPDRPRGGVFQAQSETEILGFKQRFSTLGDLYQGSDTEKQGAILIDAHYAANAVGATCTARPEDTDLSPDGTLYITFTSGVAGGSDGSPDTRIFRGPNDSISFESGWIMALKEHKLDPAALTFSWAMVATGGEPAAGGMGFANPDNLAFDREQNLWFFTDIASGTLNRSGDKARGIYGNNSIWCMPTQGPTMGKAFFFGYGPMDAEITGPCFSPDYQTLFLAIQHPGEVGGTRKDRAVITREFTLRTTDGKSFVQQRTFPIGSNWPSKQPNTPPRSAIVAVSKTNFPNSQ